MCEKVILLSAVVQPNLRKVQRHSFIHQNIRGQFFVRPQDETVIWSPTRERHFESCVFSCSRFERRHVCRVRHPELFFALDLKQHNSDLPACRRLDCYGFSPSTTSPLSGGEFVLLSSDFSSERPRETEVPERDRNARICLSRPARPR